jgi:hypothetical protein
MRPKLPSSLCTEATLKSEDFLKWAEILRPAWDHESSGVAVLTHRKLWEWLFIVQALFERGKLAPGMRGIGFGVGQDPLAALFADMGCQIVATDLDPESATSAGWADGVQYSTDLKQLNQYGICNERNFERLVSLRAVDMNHIPFDLRGFDFSWSACAFEHLGSIELGKRFITNQMRCLKRGGVGVHTTEYNVSSNDGTVDNGPTVIFRERDIEDLVSDLHALGHAVELNLDTGSSEIDQHVDDQPYTDVHLKIMIGDYVATSIGLIVEKAVDRSLTSSLRRLSADSLSAIQRLRERR